MKINTKTATALDEFAKAVKAADPEGYAFMNNEFDALPPIPSMDMDATRQLADIGDVIPVAMEKDKNGEPTRVFGFDHMKNQWVMLDMRTAKTADRGLSDGDFVVQFIVGDRIYDEEWFNDEEKAIASAKRSRIVDGESMRVLTRDGEMVYERKALDDSEVMGSGPRTATMADLLEDIGPKAVLRSGIVEALRDNKPVTEAMRTMALTSITDALTKAEAQMAQGLMEQSTVQALKKAKGFLEGLKTASVESTRVASMIRKADDGAGRSMDEGARKKFESVIQFTRADAMGDIVVTMLEDVREAMKAGDAAQALKNLEAKFKRIMSAVQEHVRSLQPAAEAARKDLAQALGSKAAAVEVAVPTRLREFVKLYKALRSRGAGGREAVQHIKFNYMGLTEDALAELGSQKPTDPALVDLQRFAAPKAEATPPACADCGKPVTKTVDMAQPEVPTYFCESCDEYVKPKKATVTDLVHLVVAAHQTLKPVQAAPTALFLMDDDPEPFTLEDFMSINAETMDSDDADIKQIAALKVGESCEIGGGAWASFTIRRIASTNVQRLSGSERNAAADQVWSMYQHSYEKIGMHVSNQQGLLAYDTWDVMNDDSGKPIAFNLYKSTPFGLKSGLLGSDGTSAGKAAVKQHVASRYETPGVYGEVSHAVEKISAHAPVVCAVKVADIIGKPVTVMPDGVHYKRALEGVGEVVKKMVGNPKGVESGSGDNCPVPEGTQTIAPGQTVAEGPDEHEAAEHCSCQIDLEDEPVVAAADLYAIIRRITAKGVKFYLSKGQSEFPSTALVTDPQYVWMTTDRSIADQMAKEFGGRVVPFNKG